MRSSLLIPLVLSSAAMAQFVSPVGYANQEGSSSNTFPWNNTQFTYQQVHGDMAGARPIVSLAFRRDGTGASSTSTARTVTLDAFMGEGSYANVSTTFASNYISGPTQVITNKSFNLPDWTVQPIDVPQPFTLVIANDTPFAYTGTNDMVWEFRITNSTATGSYFTDYSASTGTTAGVGSRTGTGTGCTTANGVMTLRSTFSTSTTAHSFVWNTAQGPTSAAGVTLVGLTAVSLPFPLLCTGALYTDGSLLSLPGTTNATGTMNTTSVSVPYNTLLIGASTYAQSAAVDATQPGLALAASNGLKSTIVDLSPAVNAVRIYASGNSSAVTGTLGRNALITQFN